MKLNKKNIVAICGSTRKQSSNLNLIKAIALLSTDSFNISIFEGLSDIPHFNPDDDNDFAPAQVTHFRKLLRDADGILISTPEYAMGVPGALKNAIDWTVSSMEFSQKPVALITASLSGKQAHKSLLKTLLILEAKMTASTQLIIPFIKTKLNQTTFTDQNTHEQIEMLIRSLYEITNPDAQQLLAAPYLMDEEN